MTHTGSLQTGAVWREGSRGVPPGRVHTAALHWYVLPLFLLSIRVENPSDCTDSKNTKSTSLTAPRPSPSLPSPRPGWEGVSGDIHGADREQDGAVAGNDALH